MATVGNIRSSKSIRQRSSSQFMTRRLNTLAGAVDDTKPPRVRFSSPWDWRSTQPDHVLQEDIITSESLQVRSAPLYDAVIVTGELAGKA